MNDALKPRGIKKVYVESRLLFSPPYWSFPLRACPQHT